MKRIRCFVTARPRTVPGVGLVVLTLLFLIAGVLLPAPFSGAAWALFGIALTCSLVVLWLPIRGGREATPADRPYEHMEPSRLEALISLFTSLENRPKVKKPHGPCNLLEQTEEEYQKEQAEWLAKVKRKQGNKTDTPPAGRD
ncbi:hypothetical protein [Desulfoluna limicola]|nr:hypothetical protein [Desulfoluna limicola]